MASGSGATFFLTSLLDHPDCTPEHLKLMSRIGLGGSPVPAAVTERMAALGISAIRSYGSTEHPSTTGSRHEEPEAKRHYTDGHALLGVELRLVDEDGAEVATGERGEILSRGPDCCVGYTDPALTSASFDAEGWFATGDVGVLDEDGYLTIVDRKKDIIIRGGENISALEVEEMLMRIPGVAEAAVVAAPDERLGEHVCAFVRLAEGSAPVDLADDAGPAPRRRHGPAEVARGTAAGAGAAPDAVGQGEEVRPAGPASIRGSRRASNPRRPARRPRRGASVFVETLAPDAGRAGHSRLIQGACRYRAVMRGGTEPTRAARTFRVVVILAAGAVCASVRLPWCRISGFNYTFFDVDTWKVLPTMEVVVAVGAAGAALLRLSRIKRIGLFLGATTLVLNLVGAFVAARLANVHNSDPYYRVWAVLSVRPALGAGIALLAAVVLIVGGLSRWAVSTSVRDHQSAAARPLYSDTLATDALHGIPRQRFAPDD